MDLPLFLNDQSGRGRLVPGLSGSLDEGRERLVPDPNTPLPAPESMKDAPCPDWIFWQLLDSAFPTGSFAHSGGLEAACQYGEVRTGNDWLHYTEASVHQAGHASLPFVNVAHRGPHRLAEFDGVCDAFMTNHVANRASRSQGRALLTAVQRIFLSPAAKPGQSAVGSPSLPAVSFAHLAPVFGAVTRLLGIGKTTALRLFLFQYVRGFAAAAVKLNLFGPLEAQRLQARLAPATEHILKGCATLDLDQVCQTAPLLEIWQGGQDRLSSRLFQS